MMTICYLRLMVASLQVYVSLPSSKLDRLKERCTLHLAFYGFDRLCKDWKAYTTMSLRIGGSLGDGAGLKVILNISFFSVL